MYKHYIRPKTLNNIRFIVYAFCDAFEAPTQDDILVEESEIRQYNPVLLDMNAYPMYKWDQDFVPLTAEELDVWKQTLPKPQPTLEEQVATLQAKLTETQKALTELILGGGI